MKLLIVYFALSDITPVQLFQLSGLSTSWSSTVWMTPHFVIHVVLVNLYFFVLRSLRWYFAKFAGLKLAHWPHVSCLPASVHLRCFRAGLAAFPLLCNIQHFELKPLDDVWQSQPWMGPPEGFFTRIWKQVFSHRTSCYSLLVWVESKLKSSLIL